LIVGLIDDFGALSPRQKTFGQLLAALVLIKSGIYIKLQFLPLYLCIPLTVLWILAVTNAFNIIDIMDGLASGVATIAAIVIAAANFMAGREPQAFLAVVLAGSALDSFGTISIRPKYFSEIPAACSWDSCWPRFP
jgi:UDP-N-acetylmuramyl pentapeptide phosphotransferase/UDP-N-acetylglucosamine-1-phosphate transferase